ncbi:hypothetical protein Kpol_1039p65 [Vanderwaltozyma polyspora DSM 70294]|uniref:Protein NSG2 n=1 Tax=Vanderwaltozyma polyspora (strain ATCC 22028 / DSM 70294 / BCRC 21397 / CBS 2163 / NBRC 10782 / NRRL Y-8283 / UCD 57-17) TaxID=436907 RepID=A7THJ0_VANPO|nr:uncharacterized protein Kpol_1039p65 [Vanderwaltozyma polyspora DSM 70294]EDO18314.1 hypothetical protein Kpol_1039p65 [Vanderwaltozyma polyspora DSM 70294]
MAKKKSNNKKKSGNSLQRSGSSQTSLNKRVTNLSKGPIPSVESFTNLTKPQLFSIYDEDITKSEDNEIYKEMNKGDAFNEDDEILEMKSGSMGPAISRVISSNNPSSVSTVNHHKSSTFNEIIRIISIVLVLSLSGIGYHQLSKNLHDNHQLHPDLASKPLLVVSKLSKVLTFGLIPDWAGYSLEGVIFGLLIPLFDYIFDIKPKPISTSSIIRSVNAMLGVTYGIRKVEWASSLQASGAWALLNIILWLFFDGTLSMFWCCAGLGFATCAAGYSNITHTSQLLYFMDFYFLGFMLFGKLGRYLLAL